MGIEVHGYRPGVLKANADLSSKQFYFVKQVNDPSHVTSPAALTVDVPSVDGDYALGVLQNKPQSGEACTIEMMMGAITKVILGGTVYAGDFVGCDSSGRAITKQESISGADTGDWVLGQCLEGGAVGEIGTIKLGPQFKIEQQ